MSSSKRTDQLIAACAGCCCHLVGLRIKVAGGKMVLVNGYHLRRLNLAFTSDDIRAAGVETAARWGINGAGWFTGDN